MYIVPQHVPVLFSLSHNRKQRRADILTEEDSSSDSIRSGGGLHSSSQRRSSSRQYELPHWRMSAKQGQKIPHEIPFQNSMCPSSFYVFFFLSLMCDETVFVLLQVSLTFSSSTALPGEKRSLNLKASPGSLCSVRAIDQSVLLLRPETELNAAFVCYIIHNLHYNYS